jgi:serine/threonine-protein kinase HipA
VNHCPIAYEPCEDRLYSVKGLHLLSRKLENLKPFPYSSEEQVSEAVARASKMSIQGIQPKLSARINIKKEVFEIVDRKGMYILKPQNLYYKELPQNEDLTMRLANLVGLEVPLHGMIYSKDGSFTYFVKRFDRTPRGKKFAVEDFAQLAGLTRDTKYNYSMEKVAEIIELHCTFPEIEKIRFFKLILFNFLTGNEDAHLKNFSLITRSSKAALTPFYDLLNTTIVTNSTEEIALPLAGKKKNLTAKDLINYFAKTRLNLNEKVINETLRDFSDIHEKWIDLLHRSFLSEEMKLRYEILLNERKQRLGI